MQLVCRKSVVGYRIGEQVGVGVIASLEAESERVPHRTVRAVATDDVRSFDRLLILAALHDGSHAGIVLLQREERGLVLDGASAAAQLLHQEPLRFVLRHHPHERVRRPGRMEIDVPLLVLVREDAESIDAVGCLQEGLDDAGHVENFERPRKDCECLRVRRLRRICFDDAIREAVPSALGCKEQAHWARSND